MTEMLRSVSEVERRNAQQTPTGRCHSEAEVEEPTRAATGTAASELMAGEDPGRRHEHDAGHEEIGNGQTEYESMS